MLSEKTSAKTQGESSDGKSPTRLLPDRLIKLMNKGYTLNRQAMSLTFILKIKYKLPLEK